MANVAPSQVVDLIDQAFPWAKDQQPGDNQHLYHAHAGVLLAISHMIAAIPDELIQLQPPEASRFNAALWTLRGQLDQWATHGPNSTMDRVKGLDTRNPVSVLRQLLAKCPDEAAPTPSRDFLFIKDTDLRSNLASDLAAVAKAGRNSEWKAATVLGGSLLEALLLWAITSIRTKDPASLASAITAASVRVPWKKSPPADPEEWGLHQLLEVCVELKLIGETAATQARIAKDFRNLIHPGRAIRVATSSSLGTASATRAAIEFVTADLAKKFP